MSDSEIWLFFSVVSIHTDAFFGDGIERRVGDFQRFAGITVAGMS